MTGRLRGLRAAEAVLIDTCHRSELVSIGADPAGDAPPAQRRGADAVRRVFEVVAGLDSAVVAEEQLIGQVREAYEAALAAGRSGPVLNELMRRAIRFGRLVRSHARPGTDRSLADPAVAWLQERLEPADRVVVAGTGQMGRLIAHQLAHAGFPVTVLSSSAERGARLLKDLVGDANDLRVGAVSPELVAHANAFALAVGTRAPILTAEMLPADAVPWVMDLSAPPAVEATLAERLGDRLLSLDRLGERRATASVLAPAVDARLRRRLHDEVAAFIAWLDVRRGADALAVLHHGAEDVRRRHLDRLRRRGSLDEAQLAAVEAASAAMVGELLHGPTLELRHGGADAETVRRLFRIDA